MLVWGAWKSSTYCNDWFLPTHPLWPLQVFGHFLKSWEGDTMGGNISSIPGANGRSSSKLWTLSVSLMPPGDEQASRPPGFSLLLFSWSLKEGREARPQHYAFFSFLFFFLNRTCGGWKFTGRQAGNNNFCSHDSTVSPLLISPPFLCVVFVLCCSAALQGTVSEWWGPWEKEQIGKGYKGKGRAEGKKPNLYFR